MVDSLLQNAALFTATIAILLFVSKETIEFCKLRNKRQRELKAAYFLLSNEIKQNIVSLENLEKFCSFIELNKDRDKTRFDVHPPVSDDFYYCMATIGDAQIQLPLHIFHTKQYEKLIYNLIELDSEYSLEISEYYAEIYTIQKQQHQIIKLMKGELQGFLYTSTITILVGFLPHSSARLISQLKLLSAEIYKPKKSTP